jgi:hypothetical protein
MPEVSVNGKVAPIPAVGLATVEPLELTQSGLLLLSGVLALATGSDTQLARLRPPR